MLSYRVTNCRVLSPCHHTCLMRSKKQPRHANLPEVQVELARRSVSGAMSYFGLLLVVGFFTPYASDHPHVFDIAVGAFLVMGLTRIILARAIERRIASVSKLGVQVIRLGRHVERGFLGNVLRTDAGVLPKQLDRNDRPSDDCRHRRGRPDIARTRHLPGSLLPGGDASSLHRCVSHSGKC